MHTIIKMIAIILSCAGLCIGSGCSSKGATQNKPVKKRAVAAKKQKSPTLAKTQAKPQAQAQPMIGKISDNPGFFAAADKPLSAANQDLDAAVRPVLKQIFEDVKVMAEDQKRENFDDIHSITYVLRRIPDESDGVPLHAAFSAARFTPSPRLGSKPTVSRQWLAMSFFKTTGAGQYSLAIYVDINNKVARVHSYALGSKYDRLM